MLYAETPGMNGGEALENRSAAQKYGKARLSSITFCVSVPVLSLPGSLRAVHCS